MKRIYLDNNASTPLHPQVLEAVVEELNHAISNPSSVHFFGQESRKRLTKARDIIASFFELRPSEVIFTSGSTESNNMIIRGIAGLHPSGHMITSEITHSSLHETIRLVEGRGYEATYLKVGLWGAVKAEDVQKALRSNTRLIALNAANNETGVKTDIEAIAAIAEEARIPFLVDGVALFGKEPFSIPRGVSAVSLSGHKFHAPKGIGLALIRSGLQFDPLMIGGGQEYGRRSGTENLAGIIGLAKAIEVIQEELPEAYKQMKFLRDRLEEGIIHNLSGVYINGEGPRIVNTSNLSFEGVDGESLLAGLDMEGVAASHGSACSAGGLEPSRILLSMGVPKELAQSTIRFSLSSMTTQEEIDRCIEIVTNLVTRLRSVYA